MLLSILLALGIAKFKRFRLKPVLTAYALYPFFFVELVYWVFQITVFAKNYTFLPYAEFLKTAYFLTLLVPILVYKLYAPALAGSASVLVGTGLNRLAMSANGGKMPVFPSLSLHTGYFSSAPLSAADTVHCLGGAGTRLKILCDYIDIGWSILSVGDLLIHAFSLIILYYSIKAMNKLSNIAE